MNPSFDNGDTIQPRSRRERFQPILKPLLLVFVVSLLAFTFAKLGSEINEGETHSFDMWMLQGAQALRLSHPWMAGLMRDLSGLGSEIVLTLITVATVGYLALISARATAMLVAASVISGTVLMNMLKLAFGRLRPDLAYAELSVPGLSFPSGHASMSAIVFLTIGALLASTHKRLAERIYILTAAMLLTLLVGLSRIALGVHWTTDVFGGWTLGAAWALAWLLLARHLSRRQ
ncbi:MAG: phosphatase PAP2 family protein [Gammaproteobacteria bacterium]|nr:phosphatase PAP2 family protein [Gammaproteobacteria bacterium]MBU0787404.1 phosphatase PAP2 family protein [Gammaproteobacteria bacterium]MBU0815126.1 phosphatase PAP2 family protein [Gammaproteobacteria bacterium]MBU1785766.1 phosphatase PAP2 family protein [Gammaproteobacteria bacterium]